MATIIKRTWLSKGPTGHKVRRVAYGYTLQVGSKRERKFDASWSREDACRASRTKYLADVATVALETGLRKAELLGLIWDRVDLSRGALRLEVTKSGRRREVPMRQAVYNLLSRLPGARDARLWPDRKIRAGRSTRPWSRRGSTGSASMTAGTTSPRGS